MQTANAIAKLIKAGFQVASTGNRYRATANSHVISFSDQSGDVICINVRRSLDQDDSRQDYTAGVFCSNISQAIKLAH